MLDFAQFQNVFDGGKPAWNLGQRVCVKSDPGGCDVYGDSLYYQPEPDPTDTSTSSCVLFPGTGREPDLTCGVISQSNSSTIRLEVGSVSTSVDVLSDEGEEESVGVAVAQCMAGSFKLFYDDQCLAPALCTQGH